MSQSRLENKVDIAKTVAPIVTEAVMKIEGHGSRNYDQISAFIVDITEQIAEGIIHNIYK